MGIKRKRSITTLSPASVSSTAPSDHDVSVSPSPFPLLAPSIDMCMGMDHGAIGELDRWNSSHFPQAVEMLPKHLHSRTRKRVRDGRPDEDVIHEQTLQKLFSAQKQPQHQQPHAFSPPPSASTQPRPPSSLSASSHSSLASKPSHQTQQSLHSFFPSTSAQSLPRRTSSSAPPVLPPTSPPKCEDCDRPLHALSTAHPDAMDMDLDVLDPTHLLSAQDDDEAAVFGCLECGRKVCDTCSIRDGADTRLCLSCTCAPGRNGGEKRWVGGIGWM